jgi:sigma-54 dependent transcriptional regulator, acetoin dehydrogenase operon transcriptional activator AcoR
VWRWETQPALRRELERVSVIQGHQFVEDGVGTCGVGLSMAVHQPTVVVGAEHYKHAWHRFTCATAPVVDPITRRRLGALNVCCLAEDTNRYVIAAVMAFTERMRSALRDVATPRQRRLMDAHLRFRGEDVAVVTLDSEIMITDDGFTDHLPDRATLWSALTESGPATTELVLPNGRVAQSRPVTPGRFEDGCVLIFSSTGTLPDDDPLGRAEADVIRRALVDCGGNKSAAAQQLGISRGTLYQRIRRYKLD